MSINGTKQSFWLISNVKLVLLTFYHILFADAKIKHGKWRLNSIPCFGDETNAPMWGGIEHLVLFIIVCQLMSFVRSTSAHSL